MHTERMEPAHRASDRPAAPVSTAVDLLGPTTADLAPKVIGDAPATINCAAEQSAAASALPTLQGSPPSERSTTGAVTRDNLPLSDMPKQRAWGFFVFLTSVLVATLVATRYQSRSLHPETRATAMPIPQLLVDVPDSSPPETPSARTEAAAVSVVAREARTYASARATEPAVTIASSSIVTSEQASAAVFIISRVQPARGSLLVEWAVRSGSADAAIDFSDASGTVRFADGQRASAIYVPLRNDLLREDNETFTVCLRSPQEVRTSEMLCAEATILHDDSARP